MRTQQIDVASTSDRTTGPQKTLRQLDAMRVGETAHALIGDGLTHARDAEVILILSNEMDIGLGRKP